MIREIDQLNDFLTKRGLVKRNLKKLKKKSSRILKAEGLSCI